MPDKSPDNKDGLPELLKNLWLPVAGFMGAVTLAYNFYQLWLGDQATVIGFLAGGGLVILILVLMWVGFKKTTIELSTIVLSETETRTTREEKRLAYPRLYKAARILLAGLLIGIIGGVVVLIQHRRVLEEKLVVLIATFDGPEDVYGLHNEIVEKLKADFVADHAVIIVPRKEVITPDDGNSAARALGKRYLADIVIWGWYLPTKNPNVTVHVENMSPEDFSTIEESSVYQPKSTLDDLASLSLQKKLSVETKSLVLFLSGYMRMKARDCQTAISAFELVSSSETSPELIDQKEVFFLSANCHGFLKQYEQAISELNKAIALDSQFLEALNNRALFYARNGDYEAALEYLDKAIEEDSAYADFYVSRALVYNELNFMKAPIVGDNILLYSAIWDLDTAIQLEPENDVAYNNRGAMYLNLGYSQRAIEDFTMAIKIEPDDATTYNNRGTAYAYLGHYQEARSDFSKAIKISPKFILAYTNRSGIYLKTRQYTRAILDLDKAIQINPNIWTLYFSRGLAYYQIQRYERAIEDFDRVVEMNPEYPDTYQLRGAAWAWLNQYEQAVDEYSKAIQLQPNHADAYRSRGYAYQQLGKTAEAEADFKKYEELTEEKP